MSRVILAALVILLSAGWLLALPAHADDTRRWDLAESDAFFDSLSERFQDLFLGKPRLYWDRGLHLETPEKALDLHVGFEFQGDAIWYSDMDDRVEQAAGAKWITDTIIRRSRIYIEGFVLRYWYFRARFNWNLLKEPSFQDLFLEYSGFHDRISERLPVIRLGQVKEPMSLDWMTGANWTTFAERSMVTAAIAESRQVGIRFHGSFFDRRMTYQAGYYRINSADQSEEGVGTGDAITVRVTGLPWAPKGSPCRYLHLGMSGSIRWNAQQVEYRTTPESAGGPDIVSTGRFSGRNIQILGAELAYGRDRFSAQAEAIFSRVRLASDPVSHYRGWYAQASYFLTKPCRNFRRRLGAYGRIHPERTLLCKARSGYGAWEVAGRVSYLNLDSRPHKGGEVYNVTLGLNWYARDNLRVTLNAMRATVWGSSGVAGADGSMTTLLLRFQYNL